MNEMTEWKRIDGATNAPAGCHWENNGKSRFGGEYEHRLVKDAPETEQRPAPIREGDIVEITGAYFKNDNGLWLVIHANDAGDALALRKLGKTGKLLESGSTSASWPLRSYCSDPRKNAEAERHNAEHAKLTRAEGVPTWYAAEYFRKEAEWMTERAEQERSGYGGRYGVNETGAQDCERAARRLAEIADRLAATAEQPKQKAPEAGIRFYWNGIKVDGGKLVPCFYSLDNNRDSRPEVHIMARNYGAQLPRQYFTVTNETDSMTDYFDTDSARLTPDHPLYKFARYAATKHEQKGQKSRLERAEKALAGKLAPTSRGYYEQERAAALERLATLERETDPGQPTAADLAAVAELNTAKEDARRAAEQAAQLAEREKVTREKNAGRAFIEQTAAAHPIAPDAPVVTIEWSEHPAFYSWDDGALKLSPAAAEIVLKHYDEERAERNRRENSGGYDKTKFTVAYTDPETGEEQTFTDRYDLGDNDGGLVAHVRAYVPALADLLEQHTAAGRVVNVEFSPQLIQFAEVRKKAEQRRQEQAEREIADLFDAVELLTDEQLEAAVFAVDRGTESAADIARFFLQALARRNREKALDVYRRWKSGA